MSKKSDGLLMKAVEAIHANLNALSGGEAFRDGSARADLLRECMFALEVASTVAQELGAQEVLDKIAGAPVKLTEDVVN